jgi:diguanylate cyclase (GGDEF)-like protein
VPLAIAGWRLGRGGAVFASLLSTTTWTAMLYVDGFRYSRPHFWVINFLGQGIAFLIVSLLVAKLSEALRKERARNRTDPLTGLRSRSAFIEQAGLAVALCKRHARPVAVAFIDLDHFKNINDSFGHAKGDDALRHCGHLIRESLRASDIGGRLGGDEYAVVLPETDAVNAAAFFARLHASLETSTELRALGVSASIGVVVDASGSRGIEDMIRLADVRMYGAKHAGRNRVSIHLLDPPP